MLVPEAADRLVGAVFGDDHAPTFPDVWFLALLDENGDELTGTGYARTPVENTSQVWEVEEGAASNLDPIEVGAVEEDDWADIYAVALLDENGEQVFVSELADPFIPVYDSETPTPVGFDAGAITITLAEA